MIQTIEQATQTRVIIGQNGIVVVTGRDTDGLSLAVKAIKMVEEESHTTNLTQRVKTLLNVQDPVDPEQPENIDIHSNTGTDSSTIFSSPPSTNNQMDSPAFEQPSPAELQPQPQPQNPSNEDSVDQQQQQPQNPSNEDSVDTAKIQQKEQSENNVHDNLTNTDQKEKKQENMREDV
jgi:exosome complex component RRP4